MIVIDYVNELLLIVDSASWRSDDVTGGSCCLIETHDSSNLQPRRLSFLKIICVIYPHETHHREPWLIKCLTRCQPLLTNLTIIFNHQWPWFEHVFSHFISQTSTIIYHICFVYSMNHSIHQVLSNYFHPVINGHFCHRQNELCLWRCCRLGY